MAKMQIGKMEKARRLIRVESMLIDGFRFNEIVAVLSQEWNIKERMVAYYIGEVKNRWKSATLENAAELKLKYIDRLEKLYRLSVEKEQFGTAVKVQDTINRLVGLYDREQSEETGPSIITISGRSQTVNALSSGPSEIVDATENDESNGTGTQG